MSDSPIGWVNKHIQTYVESGGSPEHPQWYRNLDANPLVQVQVGARVFRGTARTAVQQERQRLWRLAAEVFPTYDSYQDRAEREIPVVVLTPS